ncbi:MAG TPA: hypothetical protein VH701_23710 [Vicinamibacterales bacterium]|jgi:uncharacterized membrane protein
MTETRRIWLGMAVPSGFKEILVRTVMAALVAFVALLLWDQIESGDFDPVGIASNAMAVAVGWLLLDTILALTHRAKA